MNNHLGKNKAAEFVGIYSGHIRSEGLALMVRPLSIWIIDTFDKTVPQYNPFFLDPRINPATVNPMTLTSGIDVSGRWSRGMKGPFFALCHTYQLWLFSEIILAGMGLWAYEL